MGSVWAATHTVTRKSLALKFLKAAHESPELRRRFLREARAACAVDHHPNVRAVHDVLELDDGLPVLVMERLEGESLAQRLAREGKLSVPEVARILVQVVSAVGTAHSLGIIHRDLKPENVFLTSGVRPAVKVLDFGIAKVTPLEEQTSETAVTSTGMMLGTPCYMSPEQVFGEKDADHRIDIWAIGLILYRALTGILPTQGDNVGQVMKVIVTRAIRPIAELEPELPPDLAAMVGRMLSRNRSNRPDLLEVQAVLAKYTDASPPEFGPPASKLTAKTAQAGDLGLDAISGDTTAIEAAGNASTVHPLETRVEKPGGRRLLWRVALPLVAVVVGVWALQLGGNDEPSTSASAAPTSEPSGPPAPVARPATAAPTPEPPAEPPDAGAPVRTSTKARPSPRPVPQASASQRAVAPPPPPPPFKESEKFE